MATVTTLSVPSRSRGGTAPCRNGRSQPRTPASDGRDRDGGQRLRRPPGCAAAAGDRDGNEREQADRREQRAGDEDEPEAGIAPEEREPGERDGAVGEGEPERDVAEREHRCRERQREAGPRRPERGQLRSTTAIASRAARGIERQHRRADAGGEPRRGGGSDRAGREFVSETTLSTFVERLASAQGGAQLLRQRGGGRALGRVARERVADAASRRFGRSGRSSWSGGAPASIVPGHLRQRDAPERVLAGERLPEQDPDAPDVAGGAGFLAAEALGRDVGERAGHVADGGQRLRLVELGETEVEQADGDARVVVGEQDVRRLDVAVDDPAAVRVRETVEDLRRRLDRLAVAQLAGAHRVPERPAADVLVGDVDVAGVGAEAVGAEAALVPQARRRLGLALRAVGGLALARDDLQRHVETRLLVAREPDRAGAAAAERPQRAVAVEDELPARERMCSGRHGFSWFGRGGTESFRASTAEPTVTVAPIHPVEP